MCYYLAKLHSRNVSIFPNYLSTTMEASTVWAEMENGSENVEIKHEPLEPYVEYPVSLFIFIHIMFYRIYENK